MSIQCILTEQIKASSSNITLNHIAITTPPTKTTYAYGDTFDTSGMVVTGYYSVGQVPLNPVPITRYTVSPNILTAGVTSVTISTTEFGQTKTTTQSVTVLNLPVSMTITTAPTATQTYGSSVSKTGTADQLPVGDTNVRLLACLV